jgi:hypothetical protein
LHNSNDEDDNDEGSCDGEEGQHRHNCKQKRHYVIKASKAFSLNSGNRVQSRCKLTLLSKESVCLNFIFNSKELMMKSLLLRRNNERDHNSSVGRPRKKDPSIRRVDECSASQR